MAAEHSAWLGDRPGGGDGGLEDSGRLQASMFRKQLKSWMVVHGVCKNVRWNSSLKTYIRRSLHLGGGLCICTIYQVCDACVWSHWPVLVTLRRKPPAGTCLAFWYT